MINYHNIDGALVKSEDAVVSVFDIGLLRGYGIFDFFPIKQGRPLFVDDYFDRFYQSAAAMDLAVPVTREILLRRVSELCIVNEVAEGHIKLVLTGGTSADGYTPTSNNLYILQHGPVSYEDHFYSIGVRLLLQRFERDQPLIKSLNYANVLRYRKELADQSAIDLLYHDGRLIQETSRANFFIIDDKERLHTSTDVMLNGITRKHLIKVAHSMGYEVLEEPLPLEKIARAKEAFITSTTKPLLPVHKINNHIIDRGENMTLTNRLRNGFMAYCSSYFDQ